MENKIYYQILKHCGDIDNKKELILDINKCINDKFITKEEHKQIVNNTISKMKGELSKLINSFKNK